MQEEDIPWEDSFDQSFNRLLIPVWKISNWTRRCTGAVRRFVSSKPLSESTSSQSAFRISQPVLEEDRRVPCTLISGFLGAGKSTFLKWDPALYSILSTNWLFWSLYRRVLTERHGQRIAVIINEFADTAVRSLFVLLCIFLPIIVLRISKVLLKRLYYVLLQSLTTFQ